jgi:hypothetical protein
MSKSTPKWPFVGEPLPEYGCLHCGGVFPYEEWLTGNPEWPWWCPNGTPPRGFDWSSASGCDGGLGDMLPPSQVRALFGGQQ